MVWKSSDKYSNNGNLTAQLLINARGNSSKAWKMTYEIKLSYRKHSLFSSAFRMCSIHSVLKSCHCYCCYSLFIFIWLEKKISLNSMSFQKETWGGEKREFNKTPFVCLVLFMYGKSFFHMLFLRLWQLKSSFVLYLQARCVVNSRWWICALPFEGSLAWE